MTEQHPAIRELERIHSLEPKQDSWQVLHEWAKYEAECARLDSAALRGMLCSCVDDNQRLRLSVNHWRLAAVFAGAMFLMAIAMR